MNLLTELYQLSDLNDQIENHFHEGNYLFLSDELTQSMNKEISDAEGVTPTLKYMFGSDFISTVSMESEISFGSKSTTQKIMQWFYDLFLKISAWFKSFFQSKSGILRRLNYLYDHADDVKYPIHVPPLSLAEFTITHGKHYLEIISRYANKDLADDEIIQIERDLSGRDSLFQERIKDALQSEQIELTNPSELQSLCKKYESLLELTDDIKVKFDDIKKGYEDAFRRANPDMEDLASPSRKVVMFKIWRANNSLSKAVIRLSNMLLAKAKFSQDPNEIKTEIIN